MILSTPFEAKQFSPPGETSHRRALAKCLPVAVCLFALAHAGLAQPGVKELPIVTKPRERSTTDVVINTKPTQPSKGVLAVVLTPIINGQVLVKDSSGRVLAKQGAGESGQAEFQLRRGKIYQVEVTFPGFLSASGKSKPLKTNEILRLTLIPQFATLKLQRLPAQAQIFVDDQLRATVDQTGEVTIGEIKPGDHSLLIRHPEYNDYLDRLEKLEAGGVYTYGRVPLERVAKLTIQGPPNATVLIDGAVQGKIKGDGVVRIDYTLDQASEHSISVELLGYQTWSKRELLAPGPHTINVALDPIITSAGLSDYFDNLSHWNAPPSWKIISDGSNNNNKLEVGGEQLGALSEKTYRDFRAVFTIWLKDGKGATWAVRVDKESRNYYLFHLAGPNSTTHTPKKFYTYLVKDGAAPVEVDTPSPVIVDLNQKDPYTIKVEVTGHAVAHYITPEPSGEETTLGAWTDTSTTKDKFLYGSFGFRSLSGEIFTVDDLHVEPIKQ
jgi:hypothetical protein